MAKYIVLIGLAMIVALQPQIDLFFERLRRDGRARIRRKLVEMRTISNRNYSENVRMKGLLELSAFELKNKEDEISKLVERHREELRVANVRANNLAAHEASVLIKLHRSGLIEEATSIEELLKKKIAKDKEEEAIRQLKEMKETREREIKQDVYSHSERRRQQIIREGNYLANATVKYLDNVARKSECDGWDTSCDDEGPSDEWPDGWGAVDEDDLDLTDAINRYPIKEKRELSLWELYVLGHMPHPNKEAIMRERARSSQANKPTNVNTGDWSNYPPI